jgi:flagellar motility protein MotE (MotC chaperone)
MDIRIRDIIGVGVASLLLFPIVFLGVLLLSDTAHIQIGTSKAVESELMGYLERFTPEQDKSDAMQSPLYKANLKKEQELREQEQFLAKEIARLEAIKVENALLKKQMDEQREKIELFVGESKDLSDAKVEELAQVYGSMKPIEAAPILLSLEDRNIARIIKRIPEVRSQAKILAALGAMERDRAASVTKILGWSKQGL